MFDWNDLKYFLELSRSGRLVHAAKTLGVDHTTVARRIAALEQSTDTQLFLKTDKGYSLTLSGEQLLITAEKMESSALSIHDKISGSIKDLSGVVRIGAPDGFGAAFLAPRLSPLLEKHPGLAIELVTRPRYISLSKREADIAITLTRPTSGRVVARKLTDYHLQLFASKDYLLSNDPIKSIKDLKKHKLISYVDDLLFAPELRYIDLIERDLNTNLRITNLIGQYNAAIAGTGICVLPNFMTYGDNALVPILPDEICITRSFWLLIHEDMQNLVRIRKTSDFITETVKGSQEIFLRQ